MLIRYDERHFTPQVIRYGTINAQVKVVGVDINYPTLGAASL